jgi:hypothetical protein
MIRTAEHCLRRQLDGFPPRQAAAADASAPGVEVECGEAPPAPHPFGERRTDLVHRAGGVEPDEREGAVTRS